MKQTWQIIFLFLLFAGNIQAQEVTIIPRPNEIVLQSGHFVLDNDCTLQFDKLDKETARIAGFFNDFLNEMYGFRLERNASGKPIHLKLDKDLNTEQEGYHLDVNKKRIIITAQMPNGLFYGIQSLKQMLPLTANNGKLNIKSVKIKDYPRFGWRGNMLDVSRHFFPISFLKKYIDILAMYKINTFHWHLTDDQGWRLEIKKYPLLTELSHYRSETIVGHSSNSNVFDGIGYGGFYTQDQVIDLVEYAKERFITIVPEIEMPGHSSAVLAAYPNLGCTGGPYKVQTTWGVHTDVFCAGKDETFVFLKNVLDEVMEIFPSQFIHIGGDECPKDEWEKCVLCQKRIVDNGLGNEPELQSWFISQIESHLTLNGRRLIGWDEIIEGGLAPQATVMSWRSENGGIEAARQQHDAVMCPTEYMYIDYYQSVNRDQEPLAIGGFLPIEKVYHYEPIPEVLTKEEAKHILGIQTCLWTEYVPNTKHAEYMLLPRLAAQAEVAWTLKENKEFSHFEHRLNIDYKRLEKYGINYRNHKIK